MKRRLPLLAALLALVMLGAWWLRPDSLGTDPATPPAAADVAHAAEATASTKARAPTTTGNTSLASEPLPAETLPLSQRLAELERLAAGGHAEASCQLVVERLRCGFLQRWQPERGNRSRELRLESQGQLEEANAAAEATLLRIAQKRACGAAPPIESVGSLALLGPAAAAGHAPSALLYFELGHEFRNERGIFQHPHFDAWRRDAARHLHAAFEAGHPGAAHALGRAYLDDGDFANGLVPDDPRRAYLYLQLSGHLSGGRRRLSDDFHMGLDAEERERLKAEAQRLHRERFGGRSYASPELSARGPFRQPALSATDFCTAPKAL